MSKDSKKLLVASPTWREDTENRLVSMELQFPSDSPKPVRGVFEEDQDLVRDADEPAPGPLDLGYRVVCASRSKYSFEQAQQYFLELSIKQRWQRQSPMFRTARFWCKRVF